MKGESTLCCCDHEHKFTNCIDDLCFMYFPQLYLNDVEEGGETVFPLAWPPQVPISERIPHEQAVKELRESGEINDIKPGSWEEEMVANCRTKLVRTLPVRAVNARSNHIRSHPTTKRLSNPTPNEQFSFIHSFPMAKSTTFPFTVDVPS